MIGYSDKIPFVVSLALLVSVKDKAMKIFWSVKRKKRYRPEGVLSDRDFVPHRILRNY